MKNALIVAFGLTLVGTTSAFAHVTLQVGEAPAGSSYKAVFRVPHGCNGAATTAIKIQIPEGVIAVKPMPKPGWTLDLKTGNYAKTYKNWGADVSSGVTEVDFTGGNLPDAYYDEFVVTGTIADSFKAGDVIHFPIVQECGATSTHWVELPKAGDTTEPPHPAPSLRVTAPTGNDD
ncbi:MAG: DUF1775 domain-containing protein [Devosia sp.]|nr:DUF1775 domain-containing protein [Devosia sp.]